MASLLRRSPAHSAFWSFLSCIRELSCSPPLPLLTAPMASSHHYLPLLLKLLVIMYTHVSVINWSQKPLYRGYFRTFLNKISTPLPELCMVPEIVLLILSCIFGYWWMFICSMDIQPQLLGKAGPTANTDSFHLSGCHFIIGHGTSGLRQVSAIKYRTQI